MRVRCAVVQWVGTLSIMSGLAMDRVRLCARIASSACWSFGLPAPRVPLRRRVDSSFSGRPILFASTSFRNFRWCFLQRSSGIGFPPRWVTSNRPTAYTLPRGHQSQTRTLRSMCGPLFADVGREWLQLAVLQHADARGAARVLEQLDVRLGVAVLA